MQNPFVCVFSLNTHSREKELQNGNPLETVRAWQRNHC